MDGLTDAPMRAVQGQIGAFTFGVSEFIRISENVPSRPVFLRSVPELRSDARTPDGMPVHVQLLGGHPGRLAQAALVACAAGAKTIDINFGCPAPTVNNHDGGATLLKHPRRIREIVATIRDAVPAEIPVSAKMRLGWDSEDAIFENAEMAAEGGAAWLTIHGRTREQGYKPPACYHPMRVVRERLRIPVVANGDIWSVEAFRKCRNETGCIHFMLGRGALADPFLSHRIAGELGIAARGAGLAPLPSVTAPGFDWRPYLQRLIASTKFDGDISPAHASRYHVRKLKQWLNVAYRAGTFPHFDSVKRAESLEELFSLLSCLHSDAPAS